LSFGRYRDHWYLSGLIIVSMIGANNSARDARFKANMDQIRTTAELFKFTVGNGAYCSGTACSAAITPLRLNQMPLTL
jgi:hypothetical protein